MTWRSGTKLVFFNILEFCLRRHATSDVLIRVISFARKNDWSSFATSTAQSFYFESSVKDLTERKRAERSHAKKILIGWKERRRVRSIHLRSPWDPLH